ncbi:tRNA threonylcarbamoyladenosine biosynthesis protein TsaB [Inhella inkyongensis]|uniref:tRNA threonylcarbamoyladenosine biosynthesis protein TsaB n=1 Tax=Inhella inkyongensis TaxID=392593 RepID=A0A840S2M7_9BURK|nr:tRNA (adenosine(37)-N6)-threonylcarbamoyltransferase complex dimerization subunit type 1 TsaB [Inhella inkyongensis]MBB5203094.1 tRNA threonylcarbamoyladenosine biosynthesis protein TsaB [Inhella inkyongensis]
MSLPDSAPQNKPGALLALDGATDRLSLALLQADGRQILRDLPGGAQASATLVPALMALLAEGGLAGGQLDGLAFGQGPGAFTGLRAVCAVVQGLGLGWDLPVLALDSLALVAEAARQQDAAWTEGWVVMDARMQELYAAPYRWHSDRGWQALAAPALWTPDALKAHWATLGLEPACVGSGLPLLGLGAAPESSREPSRALGLAGLARQAWARASLEGHWLDAGQALPVYVRDKVALTTAEREAAAS